MPAWNSIDRVVTGTVEAVNERGVKINGAWMNVSRFATDLVSPVAGQAVALTLDKAGFIRAVAVVDPAPQPVGGASDAPPRMAAPNTRDRSITRLAVLKAASEYSASKPTSSSTDVLKIAESWERWVLRPDDDTVNAC
jgi:hypothetical protein